MSDNDKQKPIAYNNEGVIDFGSSNEELSKIMKRKEEDRAYMMQGVATQKEVFDKEVSMMDLTGGVMMKNKIKSIADSYKQFSEMLRETSASRKVDLTDEEQEHIRSDVVPTSMAAAHTYYRANGRGRLNNRK